MYLLPYQLVNRIISLLSGLILVLTFTTCSDPPHSENDPYGHISDPALRQVLKKSIDWAGGMNRWRAIDTLLYFKESKLFLADGSIETQSKQDHIYQMRPSFVAEINWVNGEGNQQIKMGKEAIRLSNGDVIQEGEKVAQTVMSSLYVLGMPFKLLDPGVTLTLESEVTIKGKKAHAVKATYSPLDHENHSTSDVWWYYFAVEDGAFLGCLVFHPPTYAYIENQAFHDVQGLKFHAHRKSYRSDSLRNVQFLRAEFWYDDYQILYASNE